jgi:hypothetical protein
VAQAEPSVRAFECVELHVGAHERFGLAEVLHCEKGMLLVDVLDSNMLLWRGVMSDTRAWYRNATRTAWGETQSFTQEAHAVV